MEASPDLQPISLKIQEMSTNNKLGMKTPTQLPNDIINGIIERLPAISNFRFKCVSKQWFSLNIEVLKRKSRTHTMSGIFYVTYKGERNTGAKYLKLEKDQNVDSCIDDTLSFLPEHCYMRIHDSCNGLLLCECWDSWDTVFPPSNSDQTSCFFVCNPATRKWVEIPSISMETVRLAILDFNPLLSVHFNVILIKRESRNFNVFSSKTGQWSVSQITDPSISQYRFYIPVLFYNGLIFAIHYFESEEIIGYDVKGNFCSRIDSPRKSYLNDDDVFFSCLGQLGGCLHYYCYDYKRKVCVWKLESGSWLLKSCFSVPFPMDDIEDIKLHPTKEDVVFLMVNNQLYSYDIKTTQVVVLCSQSLSYSCHLYSPLYLDVFGQWVEDKWIAGKFGLGFQQFILKIP